MIPVRYRSPIAVTRSPSRPEQILSSHFSNACPLPQLLVLPEAQTPPFKGGKNIFREVPRAYRFHRLGEREDDATVFELE